MREASRVVSLAENQALISTAVADGAVDEDDAAGAALLTVLVLVLDVDVCAP